MPIVSCTRPPRVTMSSAAIQRGRALFFTDENAMTNGLLCREAMTTSALIPNRDRHHKPNKMKAAQCPEVNGAGSLLSAAALLLTAASSHAVLFTNFSEAGTSVPGYQDDFSSASLNPDWLELDGGDDDPNPLFELSGFGSLLMHAANGDPNKLLYNPLSGYDIFTHEILALMRITNSPANVDGVRGGLASVSDSFSGQGINLLFRQPGQNGADNHFNLLNDLVAWGPSTDGVGTGAWTQDSYKWLRLRYSLNSDGFFDAFGKMWDAGAEPEPAAFNLSWDQEGRTGLAGLTTDSIGGAAEFEVDYVLIKADGLPTVQVVPEPASALGLGLGAIILGLRRRRA